MNLDRRIYLVTGLAALIAGSAVVIASPQDPLAVVSTIHDANGVVSSPVVGRIAWRDGGPATGIVMVSQGGTGVRAPSTALAMARP